VVERHVQLLSVPLVDSTALALSVFDARSDEPSFEVMAAPVSACDEKLRQRHGVRPRDDRPAPDRI
jgi:hypothetical protein